MAAPPAEDQKAVSRLSQPVSGRGGNTYTPRPRDCRARRWCLTANNPTDSTMSQLSHLKAKTEYWIFAKETGESGTPHIQGYFEAKNQMRLSTLKKIIPGAHFEVAKGNRKQNYDYCAKDGDFESNIEKKWSLEELKNLVRAEYKDVVWRPWQKDVLELIAGGISARTIYWIWEPTGNTGKSYLAKYLLLESSTILASGKGSDILHGVSRAIEDGRLPRLIIIDVPRVSTQYVSYQAIELLKNGCAFSGKYESATLVFPHPHVICFANSPPIRGNMSNDRWAVYKVVENELLEDNQFNNFN